MPAIAALTVSDGQATPVAHTFSPAGIKSEGNLARFVDRSTGVPIGFARITASLREPVAARGNQASSSSRVYRVQLKISDPKLETLGTNDQGITPPPTLAYTSGVNIEFVIPERASLQNRKDILAYAKNLLANAVVSSLVQDLDPIY